MEITITELPINEFNWANKRYDEVGFVHSSPDRDLVIVARVNGQVAGLGRLVKISYDVAELGGIYVFPDFRSLGIAHSLVKNLLVYGKSFKRIYCLPFSHLQNIYQSHGFLPVAKKEGVPKEILDKCDWCNKKYAGKITLLLERVAEL